MALIAASCGGSGADLSAQPDQLSRDWQEAARAWLACDGDDDLLGQGHGEVYPSSLAADSPEEALGAFRERIDRSASQAHKKGLGFEEVLVDGQDQVVRGARRDGIPTSVVVLSKQADKWSASDTLHCFRPGEEGS